MMEDHRLEFPSAGMSCCWMQKSLGWHCTVSLSEGKMTGIPLGWLWLSSNPKYQISIDFFAPGNTVHKLDDLTGHVWKGSADMVIFDRTNSYSYSENQTIEIKMLTADSVRREIHGTFEGKINVVYSKAPKGELKPVCGGEFTAMVGTFEDMPAWFARQSNAEDYLTWQASRRIRSLR